MHGCCCCYFGFSFSSTHFLSTLNPVRTTPPPTVDYGLFDRNFDGGNCWYRISGLKEVGKGDPRGTVED